MAVFPFIPESAQKIWCQLGLAGNINEYSWNDISVLGISPGHALGDASHYLQK